MARMETISLLSTGKRVSDAHLAEVEAFNGTPLEQMLLTMIQVVESESRQYSNIWDANLETKSISAFSQELCRFLEGELSS